VAVLRALCVSVVNTAAQPAAEPKDSNPSVRIGQWLLYRATIAATSP
jgi:hypothetical protein